MAFSYKQRECATCGGDLHYDETAKEYVCIYCGNHYEREESYDGQFSPRNAAVQTLSSLLDVNADMGNWDIVQGNLNDCQKVDPNYPGIIVARLAASIKRVQLMMGGNREAVRTDLAQARADYGRLGPSFDPRVNDVEADFYRNLDSSDVRSLLISVFNVFHDEARVAYISQGFDAGQIHSEQAASDLMNRAFAEHDYARIDELLRSPAKLDADALFARLLAEYPAGDNKQGNVVTVVMRGLDPQHGRDSLSDYVVDSDDPIELKISICMACVARGVIPDGRAISAVIDGVGDSAEAVTLLGTLKGGVLTDEDIETVVESLLGHAGVDVMAKGLGALSSAGYYVGFSQHAVMGMLTRADLGVDEKIKAYRALSGMGMGERRSQGIVAACIGIPATTPEAVEDKAKLLDALAGQVHALNPLSVEDYLMNNGADGEGKARIFAVLLVHVTSFASLGAAAARYPSATSDAPGVRDAVTQVLRGKGLIA